MSHKKLLIIISSLIVLILLLGVGVILYATLKVGKSFKVATPQYQPSELYSKAEDQISKGDYTVAENYLQQALQKEDDATYRNQLAVVQYRLKKYPEAIDQYNQLISKDQDVAFAQNGKGNAYRDWGKEHYSDAETAYKASIAADSDYVAAYSNLALLLKEENKRDEAIAVVQQGIDATGQQELVNLKDSL